MSNQKVRFCFITSTPMTVQEGSGTFAGITTLAETLTNLGHSVEFAAPRHRIPIYTLQRFLFNQSLRLRTRGEFDAIVGFDLDGYTVALGRGRHVASIKGVIADEMRFESGATRLTMALQARWEKFHVQRADSVITTSRYAAERIQQLYGLREAPAVVPEAIDLKAWQAELASADGKIDPRKFVVLTVCRFYPRKRLDVLLGATEKLRSKIPGLEVRIIGGGPEFGKLKRIWQEKDLEDIVKWKLNLPQQELLNEYKSCDVFCLPSVQEGFGIVFLEAMASGKPIVAARAAAVPEVVRHGVLVEPDSEDALADGIYRLYENPAPRVSLASAGKEFVKQFDSRFVAEQFLSCLGFASASPPVSYAINL